MGEAPATLGYNRALDGLRALAVAAVIAEHSGVLVAHRRVQGSFGVCVFFVISGYLITGLLVAEHDRTGRIGVRAFYRRRWARLMPALATVVAVSVAWLLATGVPVRTWWAGLVGALGYVTDFLEITPAYPHISENFEWSWSLAIEEQFYLVWPALLIALLALGLRFGRARTPVLVACAVVVLGAWIDRAHMGSVRVSAQRLNFSFDSHMDQIAFGALIAIVTGGRVLGSRLRRALDVLGLVAIGLLTVATLHDQWVRRYTLDPDGYTQVTVLSVLVVLALVVAPSGLLARPLSWPPLVHLGKLSYGLYLWNMLAVNVFVYAFGHQPAPGGWALLPWLVVLVAVAELSYRLVEQPLRRRWAHRPEPRAGAVQPRTANV
jgi:peptidoglycan/LPS O-acetylase OafA/YrhL